MPAMTNLTGVPSAAADLGIGQHLTPQELALRKKKIMAGASPNTSDPMARYGNAAAALFGARSPSMM